MPEVRDQAGDLFGRSHVCDSTALSPDPSVALVRAPMSGAYLDSLRRRAQDAPVGTAAGLALNQEILRQAPADLAAANRLGRGLEEVGRGPEALAIFERTLELRPGDAWVATRVERLRQRVAAGESLSAPVTNRDAGTKPAQRILRRARRTWSCQGKGPAPTHSLGCPGEIALGSRYVELSWGALTDFDSHRVSLACARDLWRIDV